MAETQKPNLGNRIIILIFVVVALVTIGAAIYATTSEWAATDAATDEQIQTPLPEEGVAPAEPVTP